MDTIFKVVKIDHFSKLLKINKMDNKCTFPGCERIISSPDHSAHCDFGLHPMCARRNTITIDRLEAQLSQSQGRVKELEKEVSIKAEIVDNLHKARIERDNRIAILEHDNQIIEKERDSARKRVVELEEAFDKLSLEYKHKVNEITKLNTYTDSLEISAGVRHKEAAYQDFHPMDGNQSQKCTYPQCGCDFIGYSCSEKNSWTRKPSAMHPDFKLIERIKAEKDVQLQILRNQVGRLIISLKTFASAAEQIPGGERMSAAIYKTIATYDE